MQIRYWIDEKDRLLAFDDAWRAFAVENGAPAMASDAILGRPLAGFCSDPTTNYVWSLLLARARAGVVLDVSIRCDSPDRRRVFRLTGALEADGRIGMRSLLVSEEARDRVELLDPGRPHSEDLVSCCSWCKKIQLPGGEWVEIEMAVQRLDLLQRDPLPDVSHGICAACRARLR
jgi:hypothetical protein